LLRRQLQISNENIFEELRKMTDLSIHHHPIERSYPHALSGHESADRFRLTDEQISVFEENGYLAAASRRAVRRTGRPALRAA
jgi:hypothetical protein